MPKMAFPKCSFNKLQVQVQWLFAATMWLNLVCWSCHSESQYSQRETAFNKVKDQSQRLILNPVSIITEEAVDTRLSFTGNSCSLAENDIMQVEH